MNDDLASALTRIPEPAPPPTLAATVMARIEREADLGASVARAGRTGRYDQWSGWLWVIAGTALVLGASIRAWLVDGTPLQLTSPRIGAGSMPVMMSPEDPATLLLVLGLLLYLVGLFAPLRHNSRHAHDREGR